MGEIDKSNWYCIKFDTPKNITALEFSRKMNAFLEEIDSFNHSIVNGIDETYTVASYVEDFETGSVKWWLLDKLQKVDDKAIEKFTNNPVKTTIAGILKFAKTKAIEGLQNNLTKEERKIKIINPIIEEIEKRRSDLQMHELSPPIKLNEDKMFTSLSNMSIISNSLDGKVSFIEKFEDRKDNERAINIPRDFEYTSENTQTDDTQQEGFIEGKPYEDRLILLTQTVNDGGKWEFEDGESTIKVAIQDEDFLKRYQNQEVAILPRAVFKVVRKTDKRMTKGKWKSEYYILEVLGIEKERDLFSQQ